jgi:hypothetical protein
LLNSSEGNAAEQDVFDDQEMMLGEVKASRFILWYPRASDVSVGPVPDQSMIYTASVARYLVSPNKGLAKFALVIQNQWAAYDGNAPGTWGNYTAFVDNFVELALDDHYVKITHAGVPNRPIVGLYEVAGATAWSGNLARITTLTNAMTAAGLGAPVYIQMNANVAASNAIGCQYLTSYLPASGIFTGHSSYLTMMNACKTADVLPGLNAARCLHLAHYIDNRPRNVANPWADSPTYTQIQQFWRDRFGTALSARRANPGCLIHEYSASEIDEGFVFFPSEQTLLVGVNSPTRGIFLDAHKNVLFNTPPSSWFDAYTAWTFNAEVGGSLPAGWTMVQDLWGSAGGLTGAYQYTELQNSTTTNPRTWTVTTTRFLVYGGLGAGLGHLGFTLDVDPQVDVNQDDGGARRYGQLLYDSGVLPLGPHTLAIARISGLSVFDRVMVARAE